MDQKDLQETEDLEGDQEIDLSEVESEEEQSDLSPEERARVEEEARKYGWKPKEDFTLAPKGWVDADRFLELPATEVKRLRDQRQADQRQYKADMDNMRRMNQVAMDRAMAAQQASFDAALEKARSEKRAAVEVADTKAYEAADARERQLLNDAPQPVSEQVLPEQAELDAFQAENPWLFEDPTYVPIAKALIDANPSLLKAGMAAQFEYIRQNKHRIAPDRFPLQAKPRKQTQARVEGGGLGGGRGKPKLSDKLPADAKAAAQDFVEQGIFSSVEEYAQEFFSEAG